MARGRGDKRRNVAYSSFPMARADAEINGQTQSFYYITLHAPHRLASGIAAHSGERRLLASHAEQQHSVGAWTRA